MTSKTTNKFSPEVRERAVRMVLDHEAEHASRMGDDLLDRGEDRLHRGRRCDDWVRQAERSQGLRAGPTMDERERIKALERENRELAPGQRDPAQGERVFCPGGARPPVQAMIAFIDDHRGAYGVEPICRVLPIAPSTYHAHAARRGDPDQAVGAGQARRRLEGRDPARLRGELPGLWRAQGLAAAEARGPMMSPAARWPG